MQLRFEFIDARAFTVAQCHDVGATVRGFTTPWLCAWTIGAPVKRYFA